MPAVAVDVVDTIGAGDAFSAGFLARWLSQGADAVVDAARFAAEVASVACAQRGATPPARTTFPARFRTDGGTAAPTAG